LARETSSGGTARRLFAAEKARASNAPTRCFGQISAREDAGRSRGKWQVDETRRRTVDHQYDYLRELTSELRPLEILLNLGPIH
jgi:hypothetical protein